MVHRARAKGWWSLQWCVIDTIFWQVAFPPRCLWPRAPLSTTPPSPACLRSCEESFRPPAPNLAASFMHAPAARE